MATVAVVGEQVGISLTKKEALMLTALIGRTADGTFGDLYDDLSDSLGAPEFYITTYQDAWVGTLYVRDLLP